jgi:hypothetical protein
MANNTANEPRALKKKLVKIDTPKLLKEISKRPILFDSTVRDFKKYNLRTKVSWIADYSPFHMALNRELEETH